MDVEKYLKGNYSMYAGKDGGIYATDVLAKRMEMGMSADEIQEINLFFIKMIELEDRTWWRIGVELFGRTKDKAVIPKLAGIMSTEISEKTRCALVGLLIDVQYKEYDYLEYFGSRINNRSIVIDNLIRYCAYLDNSKINLLVQIYANAEYVDDQQYFAEYRISDLIYHFGSNSLLLIQLIEGTYALNQRMGTILKYAIKDYLRSTSVINAGVRAKLSGLVSQSCAGLSK